ncbi:MAG: twin-arginine translocase TatA/TatE family subunit [Rubricoccaceae bacterium]|nr:twin-arginine translocase TatA/TatE family subunit [Rubricoccaceae bacterium]
MNLGPWEIALIFLVVLLVFGAKRIPEIARGLGKGIREFKDATNDVKKELTISNSPPQQVQPPAQQPTPQSAAPAQQSAAPAPQQASQQQQEEQKDQSSESS